MRTQTDVVVVGSGGAGLTAALSAAVAGAKVIVLERAPVFGGETAISGGGAWLPGNRAGADLGFADSDDEVRTYLDRVTMGRVESSLLESFIREAPKTFDFLKSQTQIQLDGTRVQDYLTDLPGAKAGGRQIATGLYDTSGLREWASQLRQGPWLGGIPYITQAEKERVADWMSLAKPRRDSGIVGRGAALIAGLMEACLKNGVSIVCDARAVDVVLNKEHVVGVEVVRSGQPESYAVRQGVILAAGGFEWNKRLWDGLVGVPLDCPFSPPYNEGDGLRMASRASARLGNINQVWWFPALAIPGETYDGRPRVRSAVGRGLPGSIVVNRRGKRFANESMNYDDFGKAMVAFDPHVYEFANLPAFVIADHTHIEKYPPLDWDTETPTGSWLRQAPTVRKLAEMIGVNPDGLEGQVREFNRYSDQGRDSVFHRGEVGWERKRYDWERYRVGDSAPRNPALTPIVAAPFYAYELKVGCFGTKGGPVINEEARVVNFDNHPIPGLFAAGNTTASAFGPCYPGGGSTLGLAITFGYVAGRTVAS